MSSLRRIIALRLTSESQDHRLLPVLSFAAGLTVLPLALYGVARFATTPAELLLGVLASSTTSLLLIVMGLVLKATEPTPGTP